MDFTEIPIKHKNKLIFLWIDIIDLPKLNDFHTLFAKRNKMSNTYYICGRLKSRKDRMKIYLHRYLMGLQPGDKRVVDHINHDGTDCRRGNMRICTRAENNRNIPKFKKRKQTSQFKGVGYQEHKCPVGKHWRARIMINGKQIQKNFATEIEAYKWYCEMATEHHKEYACVT